MHSGAHLLFWSVGYFAYDLHEVCLLGFAPLLVRVLSKTLTRSTSFTHSFTPLTRIQHTHALPRNTRLNKLTIYWKIVIGKRWRKRMGFVIVVDGPNFLNDLENSGKDLNYILDTLSLPAIQMSIQEKLKIHGLRSHPFITHIFCLLRQRTNW